MRLCYFYILNPKDQATVSGVIIQVEIHASVDI